MPKSDNIDKITKQAYHTISASITSIMQSNGRDSFSDTNVALLTALCVSASDVILALGGTVAMRAIKDRKSMDEAKKAFVELVNDFGDSFTKDFQIGLKASAEDFLNDPTSPLYDEVESDKPIN